MEPNNLEHAALFSALFGDSDSEEDFRDKGEVDDIESNEVHSWEKVEEVEGLWHCSHFLSITQQQSLLKAIDSEGWFSDPLHNQAMRFGDLPGWAKDLSALIQGRVCDRQSDEDLKMLKSDQHLKIDGLHEFQDNNTGLLLPCRILEREPLFDQMIVNLYQPGEGITAHVDLLRFEDGIAILSLESTCVMSFRYVNNQSDGVEDTSMRGPISNPHDVSLLSHDGDSGSVVKEISHSRPHSCKEFEASGSVSQVEHSSRSHAYERDPCSGVVKKVDMLLNPGDLILTHGPARYNWTHEIIRDKDHQVWQGRPIVQQQRVSVTLRRLCFQQDVQ